MRTTLMTLLIAAGSPLSIAAAQGERPADVLYEQTPRDGGRTHARDPRAWTIVSQEFPDYPSFSIYWLDDFVLEHDSRLMSTFVPAIDLGDRRLDEVFFAQLVVDPGDQGFPCEPTTKGESTRGRWVEGGLRFDWTPQGGVGLRGGERHWLMVWVTRPGELGGFVTLRTAGQVAGSPAHAWNPGAGWLGNSCVRDAGSVIGENVDFAFRLEGVRECRADCDGSGRLDVRDFFCFQRAYARGCDPDPSRVILDRRPKSPPGLASGEHRSLPRGDKEHRWVFDDFTIAAPTALGYAMAFGVESGGWGNHRVIGEVWTDLPDRGGRLIASSEKGFQHNHDLYVEFDGRLLPAAKYWLSIRTRRGGHERSFLTWSCVRAQGPIEGEGARVYWEHDDQSVPVGEDLALRLVAAGSPPMLPCPADCDENGVIDLRDFFCFQAAFADGCR